MRFGNCCLFSPSIPIPSLSPPLVLRSTRARSALRYIHVNRLALFVSHVTLHTRKRRAKRGRDEETRKKHTKYLNV